MNHCNHQTLLDAIHDIALHLQSIKDVQELHNGLNEIRAMARYGFDVRASHEDEEA